MAILSVPFELYVRWKLPPVSVVEEDLADAEYQCQVYDRAGTKVCEISTTMLGSGIMPRCGQSAIISLAVI
ncbi:hypothetical protein LMG23994_01715 [Cupriavidus pinatubonensis]|uniref:Uncharacterized protein n=1 Tax=Cupriavidus pinatubonensis TaxID=248026 RepID=A0ABM8WR02_9BURK|nr:hypothetical protein LMG23994_01715 [Cupriavidus pinatubonensis]